jgi:hypothetical protein
MGCCMATLIHVLSTIVFYFFFTDTLLTYYFLLFIYSRRDISISTLILYLLLILEARPTLAPLE